MHARGRTNGQIFRSPSIHSNNNGLARDEPAFRHDVDGKNAVAAGDRDQFAVGIDTRDSADVGINLPGFSDVNRGPRRAHFQQTDRAIRTDEARINVFSRKIDDVSASWNRNVWSKRGNLSVIEDDGAGGNVWTGDRMNRRAFE